MISPESKRNIAIDKRPVLSSEKEKVIKKKLVLESTSAPKVKFGLTVKVVTLMLIVSLVPLLIFAGITMKQTNDRLRNGTERLMAVTGSDIVSNVDEWIDKNVRVLKALAIMPDIISMRRQKQEP